MRAILVAGTHSWSGDGRVDWYHPESAFSAFLRARGIEPIEFTWSTDLGGVVPGTDRDRVLWLAAGVNLYQLAVPPLCPERRIPGDGVLPLVETIRLLDEIGVAVPYTVEVVSLPHRALTPAEFAMVLYNATRSVLDAARG